MNFIDKLIKLGFERIVQKPEKNKGRCDTFFNTNNGWMGLTVYHPYERFEKDNIVFDFSLERFGVTETVFSQDGVVVTNKINEKQIRCFVDGKKIYENLFGVPPDLTDILK